MAKILIPEINDVLSWDTDEPPTYETMVKFSNGREVSWGSLVSQTNGDAWNWLDGLTKHLAGKHDQSTHAGKKSYGSIDDLVKDGMSLQNSIDELYDSSIDKVANGNVAMRVLLERTGKGGKPEVVASVADLDGEPIYRGTPDENAESFVNEDYDRIGLGGNGDGYYFSNFDATAVNYAGDGSVITAGWKKDAKVMRFTNPETSLVDYNLAARTASTNAISRLGINTQASESQQAVFDNFFTYDADAYVTSLMLDGFDGVEIAQPFDGEKFTIVFNREAMQVVSN